MNRIFFFAAISAAKLIIFDINTFSVRQYFHFYDTFPRFFLCVHHFFVSLQPDLIMEVTMGDFEVLDITKLMPLVHW
jgi:hypothetical protein